jgi:hypothetical protein
MSGLCEPTKTEEKQRLELARRLTPRPRIATMSTQTGVWVPDTNRPIFDPHLDIATVVFSHVQCVKTRLNLAQVSKLWRDASKTAAAYPLRFDSTGLETHRILGLFAHLRYAITGVHQYIAVRLVDNDAALSLPSDRVFKLLDSASQQLLDIRVQEWLYHNAAALGSITLLKWARKNGCVIMNAFACQMAASNGHLHALRWLRENGCPWDHQTLEAANPRDDWSYTKHFGCLRYAVENKCPGWEGYTYWLARWTEILGKKRA